MREMQAESPRLREEVLSAQGLQESVKKAEIAVFGRRKTMAKVGDQFKIEIEDVFEDEKGCRLYKIKGFRSLVFDEYGILRLTPLYKETALDFGGHEIHKDDEVFIIGGNNDLYIAISEGMKKFVGKRATVSEIFTNALGEKRVRLNIPGADQQGADYVWLGKWLLKTAEP